MGCKSTMEIDRKDALLRIFEWLQTASNKTLARILEELNDARLENYDDNYGLRNFIVE